MSKYAIIGGTGGAHRLDILTQAMSEATTAFLERNRNSIKGRCLDLGCGNGHITRQIAEIAAPGSTVEGWDIDPVNINNARSVDMHLKVNPAYLQANAFDLDTSVSWDFIYSRFLFSHLDRPSELMKLVLSKLNRGGVLLIEDTDFSGHFCDPGSNAFDKYVDWYKTLLTKRGGDADIGKRLFSLLSDAGFDRVEIHVAQPVFSHGPGKLMAELTLDGISKSLKQEGIADPDEIDDVKDQLIRYRVRSNTVMSLPRVVQVMGMLE